MKIVEFDVQALTIDHRAEEPVLTHLGQEFLFSVFTKYK